MSYVECMVLGMLNEGYRYGYQLDQAMEERKMRYWANVSRKSIYLALQRMADKGWIEANTHQDGNMPSQKVYTLTTAGKDKLEAMVYEGLASQELVKFDYSIPIAFIELLPPDEALIQVKKRYDWVAHFLEKIPSTGDARDRPETLGKRANLRLLGAHYRMEMEWLDWLASELTDRLDRQGGDIG
ncbi:PadR family transcriptional regulator [Paenibacillus sp. 1P07SE]|uniref:PadR family transcriptional regulator n=1 Tax=Paenibacillus sp. 1P07SE TaxID=3132209 RepID=UPI0039A6E52F